jgi:peptidoglycan/xylan/chitin deacetylase (PgdA/CDA1 family)
MINLSIDEDCYNAYSKPMRKSMILRVEFFYGFACLCLLFGAAWGLSEVGAQEVQPPDAPQPLGTIAPTPFEPIQHSIIESDGTLRRIRVPILMYHYISPLPEDADAYRQDLTITPDVFHAHMQYLHDEGYSTISMYQLDEALKQGTPLPPNPIILTFDDGYIDAYTTVFPILREFGFTGTFFIITGRADANDPDYVNWQQISEMAAAGMSMESHTKNHADLRGRNYDFLVYELLGSIESLQAYTGIEPHMFAYPIGHYDGMTLDVVRELPVWRAVTTQAGMLQTTDNRLEMPRVRVSGDTGVSGLAYLLGGSWLNEN